jgi:hypothetical protein
MSNLKSCDCTFSRECKRNALYILFVKSVPVALPNALCLFAIMRPLICQKDVYVIISFSDDLKILTTAKLFKTSLKKVYCLNNEFGVDFEQVPLPKQRQKSYLKQDSNSGYEYLDQALYLLAIDPHASRAKIN